MVYVRKRISEIVVNKKIELTKVQQQLYEEARKAQENAYAPFSKYQVGSALYEKKSGRIFSGCNVENHSFGATICAERTAIFSTVTAVKKPEISELVVLTIDHPPSIPCASCMQVIIEFCKPEMDILLGNKEGIFEVLKVKDLMPRHFVSPFFQETYEA